MAAIQRTSRRAAKQAHSGPGIPHEVANFEEEHSNVKWKDMHGIKHTSIWNNGVYTPSLPDFTSNSLSSEVIEYLQDHENSTPSSVFRLFWTEEIHNMVITETNLYGRRKSTEWVQMLSNEFNKWLRVLIYMGCASFTNIRDYWSTSELIKTEFMQRCSISRDRWETIRTALHFTSPSEDPQQKDNDARSRLLHPESDPFDKVWPLLESYRSRCRAVMELGRDLYFDELAVKAHHSTFSHLIYRKLHKHTGVGFKIWALCTPEGFLNQLLLEIPNLLPGKLLFFFQNLFARTI